MPLPKDQRSAEEPAQAVGSLCPRLFGSKYQAVVSKESPKDPPPPCGGLLATPKKGQLFGEAVEEGWGGGLGM